MLGGGRVCSCRSPGISTYRDQRLAEALKSSGNGEEAPNALKAGLPLVFDGILVTKLIKAAASTWHREMNDSGASTLDSADSHHIACQRTPRKRSLEIDRTADVDQPRRSSRRYCTGAFDGGESSTLSVRTKVGSHLRRSHLLLRRLSTQQDAAKGPAYSGPFVVGDDTELPLEAEYNQLRHLYGTLIEASRVLNTKARCPTRRLRCTKTDPWMQFTLASLSCLVTQENMLQDV